MANPVDDSTHVLETLAKQVGPADEGLLEAIVDGTSNEKLVESGARILTKRIVTDGARLYQDAWTFFETATPAQKKTLRGFSGPLLALAVDQLLVLRGLEQSLADAKVAKSGARATTDTAASAATASGMGLRDQAASALRDAGQTPARRTAVDEAVGTADTTDTLARGLTALAGLLRDWLANGKKDAPLKKRLGLASLDAGYAEELDAAANAVQTTAAKAAERPGGASKADQANLDRADGVNILILGQILRAFENAHDRDATIPRLVPISTRRLFDRNAGKKKATSGEEDGAVPVPVG